MNDGPIPLSEPLGKRNIENPPSDMSVLLANNVLKLVFTECEDGWRGETNPEPMNVPYREIPKRPVFQQETKPPPSDFFRKLVNSAKVAMSNDERITDSMTRPDEDNRGWRIVVQRGDDGSATIFYSGEYPDSSVYFGPQHASGLKIFHADQNFGLQVGFVDDFQIPRDDVNLSTRIYEWTRQNGDWRMVLKPFDTLKYGDLTTVKSILEGSGNASSLFTAVRADFLMRSLTSGGERLGR